MLTLAELTKSIVIALTCVSIALLLYSAQLPQYGDGAIGTVMGIGLALAVYGVTLILMVPLIVRSFVRKQTIAEAGWLYGAIAAPLLILVLTVGWSAASP